MVNDKNHLYSKEDYQKDLKTVNKIRASQGFSRFSTAAATSLNDAGNTQAPEATQIDTRESWFRVINDTFGSVSGAVNVFFGTLVAGGRSAVTYNIYEITDDTTFEFSGTPYGKMLPFTIDFTVNKATNPPEPVITWNSSVVNPPVLVGLLGNGTRHILHFETVRDATNERQVYVGGTFTAAGGSGSQTPWLSDINAAGFRLFGLKQIEFNNQMVIADPTIAQLGADPTGDMLFNVATLDNFQNRINDVLVSRLEYTSDIATLGLFKDAAAATGLATRINFVANNITPVLMAFGAIDMEVQDTTAGNEDGSVHMIVRDQGSLVTYVSYNDNQLHEIHTFKDIVMSVATNLTIDQGALFLNVAENMSIQEVGTTIMELNSNAGISSSIQFKAEDDLNLTLNKTSASFTSPAIAVSMGQLGLVGRDPAPIFAVDGFFWHNDVTGPLKGHVFVRTAGKNVDLATLLTNPLTSDLDGDTFEIFDIDRYALSPTSAPSSPLARGMFAPDATGGVGINIQNNASFTIEEEEVIKFELDTAANIASFVDIGLGLLETIGSTLFTIAKFNGRTEFSEPTEFRFEIAATEQFRFIDGTWTWFDNNGIMANIDQLGFRTLGDIIEDDAGGMVYSTTPGESHRFRDNAVDFMELEINFARYGANFAQGGFYLDMFARANPGTTGDAQRGVIYFDSNNSNHLSVTRNSAGIDLESPLTTKGDLETFDTTNVRLPIGLTDGFVLTVDAAEATGMKWAAGGGGGGNIISQGNSNVEVLDSGTGLINFDVDGVDRMVLVAGELGLIVQIDMNTNDIEGIKALEFVDDATKPLGSVAYIQYDDPNLEFNVPTGNGFIWHVNNGGAIFGIGVSVINVFVDFDMNFNNILDSGYLEFREPGVTTGNLPANTRSWILLNDKGGSQSDMKFNISNVTNESFEFDMEGVNKLRINSGIISAIGISALSLATSGGLDMNSTNITDCNSISSQSGSALDFRVAGSTKWQINTAGDLTNLSGAQDINMSGGDIDMGGSGDILDGRDVFCDKVGIQNHQVEFTDSVLNLFIFGSGDTINFDDGSGSRISYQYDNDTFSPVNGISDLGASGRRWVEVWALNGTINTSFSKFKQDIVAQPDADCLAACANLEPIKFRWIDGMFNDMKNVDGRKTKKEAQIHFGYIADSLKQDMPEAIAEGGDDIYEQSIIALLIGSVRHLKQKNEELESRLAALEP